MQVSFCEVSNYRNQQPMVKTIYGTSKFYTCSKEVTDGNSGDQRSVLNGYVQDEMNQEKRE